MCRLIAALVMFVAGPAFAGDTAQLEILGFSADGSIFAFEEYGIQDGSGFAYANRYYIETATDRFVAGTPIRVRIDEEMSAVDDARSETRDQGQSIVEDAVLQANRGITAGFNAISEYSADPLRMEVNPRLVFPPIDEPLEIRIEEIGFQAPELCEGLTQRHVGFRLVRIDRAPGGTTELLHEDGSVPDSRGCADGYRIGAIQTFFPEGGDPVYAVLIAVRRFGFEGPDHRWIAVPGKL